VHLNNPIKQKRSLGALRRATKNKEKSPDLVGQMRLQRHTAAAILKQFGEDGEEEVVCNIAGWRNIDHNGQYLTVELSPRFVTRASTEHEDVINSIINDKEEDH
jgi:hypothetical protein